MSELRNRADDSAAITCLLPGGYRDPAGGLHRQVILRPITGRDEELLADRLATNSIPALVTGLLASCVCRLGSFEPVTPEIMRQLLVADRDYLLLQLRQLTFGSRVLAVLICPMCGQKMDMDFALEQVPVTVRTPPAPGERFELSAPAAYLDAAGNAQRLVEIRLPTAEDQERLASHSDLSEAQAVTWLLARCLLRVGDITPVSEAVAAALSTVARREIEERMESLAPQVEWDMDVACPNCGETFAHSFDFPPFFLAEVKLGREQLYREVHYLALHYHWPESEILALTRAKRRTYLDLLRAELQRGGAGLEMER